MALADACGGICASLSLPPDAAGTATIESNTNVLRPLTGGTATAESRPLHRGCTTIVVETELRDGQNKLLAKTTQTQAVLRAPTCASVSGGLGRGRTGAKDDLGVRVRDAEFEPERSQQAVELGGVVT
jgi:hypothetical protein